MNDVPRIGKKAEETPLAHQIFGKPRPNAWPAVVLLGIPLLAVFVPLCVWLTRLALGL